MQAPEIELKFPVLDPLAFQSLLPALSFHLDTPRTFEQNTLFDTPNRDLRLRRQLLRLRQYGPIWTVTHKRQPDQIDTSDTLRYKIRIETETHVDDGPATAEIFTQLGYSAVFRYEKYRTEWSQFISEEIFGHLVLDETPIGTYAELEGPTDWIDRTLSDLEIDPATCLTDSYGKLFLTWKEATGNPAGNLTFAEIATPVLVAG